MPTITGSISHRNLRIHFVMIFSTPEIEIRENLYRTQYQ